MKSGRGVSAAVSGRVGVGARNLLYRPELSEVGHGMPDPAADPYGYLMECRRRMRRAVLRFATMEARLIALEDYYIESMGDDLQGGLQMDKDGETATLDSKRGNARARAQTYALAILAEESIGRIWERRSEIPKQRSATP